MPALARAEKLGSRASGGEWTGSDIHDVRQRLREEMDESRRTRQQRYGHCGDELRDTTGARDAPRFIDHSVEETLRRACDKFASV
jgi:hypothetical protein